MAASPPRRRRVTIGPLVACTSFHNPALLAKQAATIDEIAGGRFVLGLGAGWNETEFRAFGFPFDQRVARFEEAFTIIRTLLQEGEIDFDGRFYQARDCELLPRPRPGGPPLLIGSNGPRMLRIALPHVAGMEHLVRRHRQHARPASPRCATSSTPPAATSGAIRPRSGGPSRSTSGCRAAAAGRWATTRRRDRIVPLEGSPERMADELRAYAAAGVDEVQAVLDPIDRPSIERFAEVLPLLDRG